MKRFAGLCLICTLALSLTGCFSVQDPNAAHESIQVIAMDTPMVFTAYGEKSTKSVYAAEEEIRRLEALLSRTEADSAVSRLNLGETVTVEPEIWAMLDSARRYADMTGGAFDITVAPIVSAWGFTTDSFQVPEQAEIDRLLQTVGNDHIHAQETPEGVAVTLDAGTQIDLGGIAKGYAADRTADIYREYAIPRGLARLGGNVLAWGDKPDGSAWRIGIQDPKRADLGDSGLAGVLEMKNAFAVTSGGYQRFFEAEGKTYHHIIDPATGAPSDSGLTSVTVIASADPGNSTMCDALSTALFVMGEEQALDFWRSSGLEFELVLITADDRVVVTSGAAEDFELDTSSGYAYETVS